MESGSGSSQVARLRHPGREPMMPVADKLAEWQRRLAGLQVIQLRSEMRGIVSPAIADNAELLRREVERDRRLFIAMVSVSERESRVRDVDLGCDRVVANLDVLLSRARLGP